MLSAPNDVQATYDRVADDYVQRIFHELADKPFDRELLNRFAQRVRGQGPVYDLGCGPGHVARHLHEQGVSVTGVDLSSGMIQRAQELNPEIQFRQGDMRSLDVESESLSGIVAFYSIVHFAPDALAAVFRELHRVLAPGAPLLLAFHIGNESVHLSEWWGHEVEVDFFFFDPEAIKTRLQESGFQIAEAQEREPYPEVEHQSRRAYILAEASGSRGAVWP
jgi:SAM-dependent methyltransferase